MDQSTRKSTLAGLVAVVLFFPATSLGEESDAGLEADTTVADPTTGNHAIDVQLEQRLDAPKPPRIGDPLEFVLKIDHPTGATARLQPDIARSRWKLVETRRSEKKNENRTTTRITAVFQVFRPGETTLRSQTVQVTSEHGRRLLKTNPETIHIASTLGKPGKASFQGPRPPRLVWQRDWRLVWLGGGLLGLAAIALGLFGFLGRREDELETEPDRPPEELARERLAELADGPLLEHGDFMAFYVRMSEIVRRYLGRRYGFPGTELTTAEIRDRLADTAALDDQQRRSITDWLRATDLVKFSGILPSDDEAEEQLDRALELINATAPEPEEQSGEKDEDVDAPPTNETTHNETTHNETTHDNDDERHKPTDEG